MSIDHEEACTELIEDLEQLLEEHVERGCCLTEATAAMAIVLGQVLIEYYDDEQADRVLELITEYVMEAT